MKPPGAGSGGAQRDQSPARHYGGSCLTAWSTTTDLKNLIWVWTTDAAADNLDWYPGDEYVDILGADIYAADGDFSSQVLTYNSIKDKFGGRKLITLSENGPVPDPDNLWPTMLTGRGSCPGTAVLSVTGSRTPCLTGRR